MYFEMVKTTTFFPIHFNTLSTLHLRFPFQKMIEKDVSFMKKVQNA